MEAGKGQEVTIKCAIVMVGLPARGKTYMSRKLARYLQWIGFRAKVFNVGEVRRLEAPHSINNADFFRVDNEEAIHIRDECALKVLESMISWMQSGGFGIYDATNSTRARRKMVYDLLSKVEGLSILFVESLCDNLDVIDDNIREVKLTGPDYENVEKELAIKDFKKRIEFYESTYETLDVNYDKQMSFLKICNLGSKFIAHKIHNHMQSRVIYYFMNIQVLPRVIYIARPGETKRNVKDVLGGGDDNLSERGIQFSKALASYIKDNNLQHLSIWTSLMKSSTQTTDFLKQNVHSISKLKSLNELDAGSFEGLTYYEMKEKYPDEYSLRENDKYYYRYPEGESYQDLVVRLEPIIMELEKLSDVMVICHQAVARCLLAYLLDEPRENVPYLDVPLHSVFKLTPGAYTCKMDKISFNVPAVNNLHLKPEGLVPVTSFDESRLRRKMSVATTLTHKSPSGHSLEFLA